MIIEYNRPDQLSAALELLSRDHPRTLVMGGGTKLNRPSLQSFVVVDLQSLAVQPEIGLGQIQIASKEAQIGGAVTLHRIYQQPELAELKDAIRLETSYNLRQQSTLAGTLVTATGRSLLSAALLALDAQIALIGPGEAEMRFSLGHLFALREQTLRKRILVSVNLPLNTRLVYHSVSRTPADFPIVAAAVTRWPSGRTRVTLAGFGSAPVLVADGLQPEGHYPDGLEKAAQAAYVSAGDDWASAPYRSEIAGILVSRCIQQL